MKKQHKILLIILVILANVFLAYHPHFTNPFPLAADEYNHLALGTQISENHKLPFTNPYTPQEKKHFNLESGFHFFIATIFTITPGDPVLNYKYFIPIFMIINSLLLFYLTSLLFKNYYISLLSVLFYGTIRSTGNFFVHQYFLPLTLGITLLLLSFIFFIKWEKTNNNNKNILYLFITLLAAAITYPPALTFFLGVILFYLLFTHHNINKKFNLSRKKFLIRLILTLTILSAIFLSLILFLNLEEFLIFDTSWTSIESDISPIFFFGIIPTILAAIGIFTIIKANKNKLLISWMIFSLIQIYLFYVLNSTILIPFRRLFLFYLIGISILAGAGLTITTNYIKKLNFQNKKIILIALIIIILSTHYHLSSNYFELPKIISEKDYTALKFIKQTYPKETIIIANPHISLAIPPLTGMKVSNTITANIHGGNPTEFNKFFIETCDRKKQILNRYITYTKNSTIFKTDYQNFIIYSKDKINCPFLKETYSYPYVYEVKKDYFNSF